MSVVSNEKPESEIEKFVTMGAAAWGAFLFLALGYHAGIYYAVTGYEGTFFWFGVWLGITVVINAIIIWSRNILGFLYGMTGLIFLAFSGGFTVIS